MSDVAASEPHPRRLAGGWPLVAILVAAVTLLLLSGIPGRDRVAGNGSAALQHGWARARAEAAAQPQPAPEAPHADAH